MAEGRPCCRVYRTIAQLIKHCRGGVLHSELRYTKPESYSLLTECVQTQAHMSRTQQQQFAGNFGRAGAKLLRRCMHVYIQTDGHPTRAQQESTLDPLRLGLGPGPWVWAHGPMAQGPMFWQDVLFLHFFCNSRIHAKCIIFTFFLYSDRFSKTPLAL